MEKFKLKLEERGGKPNAIRREGKIPATLYGPGVPSESVQVDAREFSRLPVAAYSHIVELQGSKGNVSALIRSVQRQHTGHDVLHIEFYRVAADRKITVTVPLKFNGTSPAVQSGGIFQENYNSAEIECLPGDIPDFVEVDVTQLTEVDSGIHFGELSVAKGIVILNPHEEVVCRVVSAKGGGDEKDKEKAAAAAAS